MPVTAKLSRKSYETFGDDIANELVEWFNRVDATYRTDLRELNELTRQRTETLLASQVSFARFDARLDQRVAASEARLDQRITALEVKVEQRFAQMEGQMRAGFAELRSELLRWMFIYWGGSVVTTVGLVLLVLSAVRT